MLIRLKIALLNLYFFTGFFLLSAISIPLLTLFVACSRPFLSQRRTMKLFRRAIVWYGWVITSIPFPFIRIRYEEQDQRPGEPSIVICNHRSLADPFQLRVLSFEFIQTVNIWPFRIPVLGVMARFSGYLNIRRMAPGKFTEQALHRLREGVSIVFFPEGTRSTTGAMGSFHGAAFRLALEAKAPLIPLCISGSEKVLPKGSLLLRPGTIRVRRLPAITWDQYKDLTAFALKNRVWKLIDRELAEMEGRA